MAFDPYQEWLSIDAGERPRTCYDLLGLAPFEDDPLRIQQAAMERTALVRRYQLGPQGEVAIRLLAELAAAFDQLSDPTRKQAYDERLRRDLARTDASAPFDPYGEWLNLPADRASITYYDLLGLELFEDDPTRIRQAALERAASIRRHQAGPHGAEASKVLADLAAAYSQLGHPQGKQTYDAELRRKVAIPQGPNRLPCSLTVAVTRRGRPERVVLLSAGAQLPASGSKFLRVDELRGPRNRSILVRILAGESTDPTRNTEAGSVELFGLPPDADASLLIHVTTLVTTHEDAFATVLETSTGRVGHTRLRLESSLPASEPQPTSAFVGGPKRR